MKKQVQKTGDRRQDNIDLICDHLNGSIMAKVKVLQSLVPSIHKAGMVIAKSLEGKGKWLLFGNGGSAADCQHLAAEMTGRLCNLERRGLPAIALTTDTSALTCIANDYSFESVFARQVEALGCEGDVALGLSTSGNSRNVILALEQAKNLGIATVAFSGKDGGDLARIKAVDLCLTVPDDSTAHVQECHIAMGHILCFLVERELLSRGAITERKRG